MKRIFQIFAMTWWLVFAAAAFSQDSCDSTKWVSIKNEFEAQSKRHELDAQKFSRTSHLALGITLVIGMLGAMTAILQRYDNKWCKIATVIAGSGVTILTVINNTAFDGDHRAFDKKAKKIEGLISDVHFKLVMPFNVDNCDDIKRQSEEIYLLLKEIHQVKTGEDKNAASSGLQLVPSAFAQEKAKSSTPAWVTNPPQEKNKIYFVGIGPGPSLKEAEASAISDGKEQATEFFTQELGRNRQAGQSVFNAKSVADFLSEQAEITNKYFSYNSKDKSYTYYVLVQVDREIAADNLKVYAVQEGIPDVKQYTDIVQATPGLSSDYLTRRRVKYEELFNKAKKEIPKETYSDFERGRQLRKTGQIAEAIEALTATTRKQPDFYLAWYNLALAYMATNELEKTDATFKKAIEHEQAQSLHDASLYNSYGWFLYLNKRYPEAVKAFEQALVIDPNHHKAKNNLETARKAGGR